MNPAYLSPLANHLWQSTLFAGIAGLLTLALRNNRARVRYWVWLAASWKFLIPFSVLISLGGHLQWRTAPQTTQSSLSAAMDEVSQPFTPALSVTSVPAGLRAATPIPVLLWTVWTCGFLGISFSWWIRWRRIRAAVRAGSPVQMEIPIRAVSSTLLLEPGVFGVFRPVVLLPEGIRDQLTAAQLKGVIAHELCHVYHRDNLVAAVHMFVETVFWFHPLVWWIGKRMVEERERACDEEVLQLGSEPRVYAEGILNVCKLYVESPLACVSGITGPDLKRRIEVIMANRVGHALNRRKRLLLATAGIAALVGPVAIGVSHAPAVRAQSRAADAVVTGVAEAPAATPPNSPFQATTASPVAPPQANAPQPVAVSRSAEKPPTFDAASIKRNDSGAGGRGGIVGGSLRFTPGRIVGKNVTARRIVLEAYHLAQSQLSGGPGWVDTDRFDLEATAESATKEQLRQMLQTLLVERFQLVTHRGSKEMSVYALMVAKNGPKLIEWNAGEPQPKIRPKDDAIAVMMDRGTTEHLAEDLARDPSTDRPVVDKTGLKGMYLLFLSWREGENILTAVEDLGLKIESQKAPLDIVIIDHIEKPSEN